MARTVYLHIGLPKSGTTYLQSVLGANKQALQDRADLLYPGRRWADQGDAVVDLCRLGTTPQRRRKVRGAWQRLAEEMRAWPGDCVVSMEWLCSAKKTHIDQVVADLAPAQVSVVLTVRDVGRTLPSAWQEFCRNERTWAWPEFLEQVTAEHPRETQAGRLLWAQQDAAALVERWTSVIAADRVHLVTLPRPGADPGELWNRFAGVVGADPGGQELEVPGRNVSLGLESTELVRRLNLLTVDRDLPRTTYNRIVKNHLAKSVLTARSGHESRIVLPASLRPWATQWAQRQIQAIDDSGVHVVGDLEELRPVLEQDAPEQAASPDPEKVLDAAVDALLLVALDPPGPGRRAVGASGGGKKPARRRNARELAEAVGARLRARRGR